ERRHTFCHALAERLADPREPRAPCGQGFVAGGESRAVVSMRVTLRHGWASLRRAIWDFCSEASTSLVPAALRHACNHHPGATRRSHTLPYCRSRMRWAIRRTSAAFFG